MRKATSRRPGRGCSSSPKNAMKVANRPCSGAKGTVLDAAELTESPERVIAGFLLQPLSDAKQGWILWLNCDAHGVAAGKPDPIEGSLHIRQASARTRSPAHRTGIGRLTGGAHTLDSPDKRMVTVAHQENIGLHPRADMAQLRFTVICVDVPGVLVNQGEESRASRDIRTHGAIEGNYAAIKRCENTGSVKIELSLVDVGLAGRPTASRVSRMGTE
jgi:hypothetical protein